MKNTTTIYKSWVWQGHHNSQGQLLRAQGLQPSIGGRLGRALLSYPKQIENLKQHFWIIL